MLLQSSNTILTFKLLSSFPARAKSNVDFPEPGGPNSKVILRNTDSYPTDELEKKIKKKKKP